MPAPTPKAKAKKGKQTKKRLDGIFRQTENCTALRKPFKRMEYFIQKNANIYLLPDNKRLFRKLKGMRTGPPRTHSQTILLNFHPNFEPKL